MQTSRNINGLPNELLCEIFLRTISPLSAQTDRCRLILVCQLWKQHVEGSALLWADISARYGPAYLRRALERSKTSLIDLHYPAHIEADTIGLESFMTEAAPHIARWRSLMVAIRGSPKSLESVLGQLITAQVSSLQRLELRLIGHNHSLPRNTMTLFNGSPAPSSLKYLTLYRVQVAIAPLSLSSLVSLDLGNVIGPSTLQLLEILRNSPELVTLRLRSISGLVGIGSQEPAIPPVALPKLSSLTLDLIDNQAANWILSTIRLPNRRNIYICAEIGRVNVRSVLLTPSIAHLLHPTILTTDPRFYDIRVEVEDSDGCSVQTRGMDLELYVDGEDHIEGIWGWLAQGLGSEAPAYPVHLVLDFSGMDPVRLVEVPSPLFIRHLSTTQSSFRLLLQSPRVAIFQQSEPTSGGWLLGQMEILSIELSTIESQKEFMAMLKGRYEEATASNQTEPSCPMSLKSVELRGRPRTEGLVEEIRGILGEINVFSRVSLHGPSDVPIR